MADALTSTRQRWISILARAYRQAVGAGPLGLEQIVLFRQPSEGADFVIAARAQLKLRRG